MSDALGTPPAAATPTVGVVSDEDHRLAMAGFIAPQTSTLAVRTGVMAGPSATTILSGTSATGTMTVNVGICHWVTSRAAGDGVYVGAKESSTTVNIAAAPGSNSRIDLVYAKQNDSGSSISPDATTGELYGVVTGTAAASPTKPALPLGAVELGTVTVAAGATNTLGAGVTINNTAPLTVARGAPVPCRNQAERDALTTFPLLTVARLDLGTLEVRNAGNTAWQTVAYAFTPMEITAYRSTNQNTGVASLTVPLVVVLNASADVLGGMTLNTSTGVVTVPSGGGGRYAVSASVGTSENGNTRNFLAVFVNGTERVRGLDMINRNITAGDPNGVVLPAVTITLAAGDQVTLRMLHTGPDSPIVAGQAITWMQLRRTS